MVHQERKREKKTYTQEIWTPGSFGTNKGAFLGIFFFFLFTFLHVHIFKYTILKCLYRASYALTRGAFHLCLRGQRIGCRYREKRERAKKKRKKAKPEKSGAKKK